MANLAIKQLAGLLTAGQWYEVRAPWACDNVLIANRGGAVDLALRSASADATTEILIPAGQDQPIVAPYQAMYRGLADRNRFIPNRPAFYLKVASGTGEGAYLLWT